MGISNESIPHTIGEMQHGTPTGCLSSLKTGQADDRPDTGCPLNPQRDEKPIFRQLPVYLKEFI